MNENLSLEEVIYNCRAMRRLQHTEVPEELLVKLISAATRRHPVQILKWHDG